MDRRHFFRRAAALACVPLGGSLLSACGGPSPAEVAVGEARCAFCDRIISARPFAAQIVDGAGATRFFDDFGCAVHWIGQQQVAEHSLTFWVMDYKGGYWIDAYTAVYSAGPQSPRGYNLVASTIPGMGELSYAEARDKARAQGPA